jgi:predicted RNase H-like nuclease
MFVAGVDGCRGGWVTFKVELATSVEVLDLPAWLRECPPDLACFGIDIPIGLLGGPRSCDMAARKLLGYSRGSSVFPAPCRAALRAQTHAEASSINRQMTGKGLSQQAWGIIPKIRQVDDAMTAACQQWVSEVHPEVCFWALNNKTPMPHNKRSLEGIAERTTLLRTVFRTIEHDLLNRPSRVGRDDLLDAAVAAWTALRIESGEAHQVCEPQRDQRGLIASIWY